MTRPIIGIPSDIASPEGQRERAFVYLTYVEALRRAGAVPVLIPPQPENAARLVETLDGLLLAGGFDCDPSLYGEAPHPTLEPMDPRRQENELALARAAHERGIPTLGICLGMQMMNVAAGGSLIQDIDSAVETDIRHASIPEDRARHDVLVAADSRLATLLPSLEFNVNSSHHQAVRRVGDGLRVTAHAPDKVVEAIEDPRHPFFIGVQWHPEDMAGEQSAEGVFRGFLEAAQRYAERRVLAAK
ncbi:MAG TPA: gamma-glutamyl-gamma-aminobutyrate hydrolase family protein [Thermoanaerobaculia bacterium]|nr:gamma-glutamyl-gamma-aminobutyrate hydrolase family protein [Thermoanaerobaculia bacterium]